MKKNNKHSIIYVLIIMLFFAYSSNSSALVVDVSDHVGASGFVAVSDPILQLKNPGLYGLEIGDMNEFSHVVTPLISDAIDFSLTYNTENYPFWCGLYMLFNNTDFSNYDKLVFSTKYQTRSKSIKFEFMDTDGVTEFIYVHLSVGSINSFELHEINLSELINVNKNKLSQINIIFERKNIDEVGLVDLGNPPAGNTVLFSFSFK